MDSVPATKVCHDCGTEKPLTDFYNATRNKDGKQRNCKLCQNRSNALNRASLREQRRDPSASMSITEKDAKRWWGCVDKLGPFDCWQWKGNVRQSGGVFMASDREYSARRFGYMIKTGEILGRETIVVPTCKNALCVNPSHMYAQARSSNLGDGTKVCACCRQVKLVECFHKSVANYDGLYAYCRECNVKKKFEERQKPENKVRLRARNVRLRFGISEDEYTAMVFRQSSLCEICGGPGGKNGLGVDHCHETGRVRALLCSNCNAGIAMFHHREDLMKAGIEYLRRFALEDTVNV